MTAYDALTGAQILISGTYQFGLAVIDQGTPAKPDSFSVKITTSTGTVRYEAGTITQVLVTSGDLKISA